LAGLLSPSDYAGYADEGRRLAVDVPNVTPMDAARFIAEATPIIGDAMAAKEIYDEATSENPNWAMVGALGGAAVLGLFPGIGDAAAKAVKSGARGLLDTAKRVEVDPNAMGSLLGNVRLKPKADAGRVFHGGPKLVTNPKMLSDPEGAPIGFSVTPIKDVAEYYKNMRGGGIVSEFEIDSSKYSPISEEDYYKFIDDFEIKSGLDEGDATEEQILEALRSNGFNAVEYPDPEFGIRVLSPDVLKPISLSSPAQEVAGLLASGRADEVTDEMLSKLTPNDNMELFELYQSGATGMDLPMDEASRMARAEAMFPRDGYHGTNADIKGFQGNVFSSDNPTLASTYARGSADAQIYPLRLGSKLGDTVVEGSGVNWSQLDIGDVKDPAVAEWLDWAEGQKISTREIEQAAIREGRSGVQFKDINDTGPGFNSNQFKNLGYTKEQERALQKQYMEDLSKPSNVDVRLSPNLVRSKFARFDPRLSNLKNLSAAIASVPGGLLALQEMQKRANEEQQRQGLLQ